MNTAQQIGLIVKTQRKKKNLSQKELSIRIFGDETHHATISRLESGKHDKVQFDTVYNALNALGVDLFTMLNPKN